LVCFFFVGPSFSRRSHVLFYDFLIVLECEVFGNPGLNTRVLLRYRTQCHCPIQFSPCIGSWMACMGPHNFLLCYQAWCCCTGPFSEPIFISSWVAFSRGPIFTVARPIDPHQKFRSTGAVYPIATLRFVHPSSLPTVLPGSHEVVREWTFVPCGKWLR